MLKYTYYEKQERKLHRNRYINAWGCKCNVNNIDFGGGAIFIHFTRENYILFTYKISKYFGVGCRNPLISESTTHLIRVFGWIHDPLDNAHNDPLFQVIMPILISYVCYSAYIRFWFPSVLIDSWSWIILDSWICVLIQRVMQRV